ncbi:hypothetical protein BKA69DRAFT_1155561 [Paraphysoderma sedebokerense]|nr:hypothetical protein BKA69DRAFT_1155561 [Paraphysoderma sedebokerense]
MSDLISPPRPTFSFLPHSSQIAQKKETYGDNLYGINSNESKYEVTLGSRRRPRTWSRVLECTSLIIAVFLNVLLYGISSTVQMQSTSVGGQICCAATSILSIPFVYYLTIRNKKIKLLSLSGVFLLMISSLITCLRPSELAMFVAAGILGIATTSNVIALFCISHSYFANHNFIFLLGNSLAIISLGLYIGIVIGYNAIALYIVIGLSTIMLVVRIFIPDGSFRSIQSISPSHSHASSSLTGFPCISSKQSPKNEEWRYLIKSLQSTEFSLHNVITLSSTSVMVGILLTIQPLLIQHYPSQAENVYVILIGLGLLQILSFSLGMPAILSSFPPTVSTDVSGLTLVFAFD